jgi:hypothetical protein
MSWRNFLDRLFPGSRYAFDDQEAQERHHQSDNELSERLAALHDEQARLLRMAARRRNDQRLQRLAEQVEIEALIEREYGLEQEAYEAMTEDIRNEDF